MAQIKIGIITCSNATQELDCCSVVCLRDLHKRMGEFQRYPAEDTLRLAGIINCAGCPTVAYPEKILKRVNAMAQFGIQALHFTYCMVALCPFLKKYTEVISRAYPKIQLVEGTHASRYSHAQYREKVACAFKENKKMADIILDKI